MGYALLDRGQFSEAVQALEKAVDLAKGQRLTRAHLARGYALAGRKREAEKIYGELKLEASRKNGSAWGAALVALALGRENEALDWLKRGYERREIAMGYLKTSQSFKPLRSDERFIGLLKKMGL